MKISRLLYAAALILFLACPATVQAADFTQVRIVAAEFPPYSYWQDGKLRGVAVDKIRAILKKLNIQKRIELYPWSRAYRIGLTTPGALLFSVARTPDRAKKFKWVGRIVHYDVKLFRRTDRANIQVSSLKDLQRYRVGGLINDVKTNYLTDNGVAIETYGDEDNGVRMLLRGRLDIMPSDVESMYFRLLKLDHAPKDVVPLYDLPAISRPLYAAFHAKTDEAIVSAFRTALDEIGEIPPEGNETIN
ncbi:substrate-binding periplasmic protein [Aestuariispira ectoiniformans]|uniref:substrate-binding periplasmic protein n=1 Tax=Aestuariispira ectoiniformans TaxID=2775080 RepID=UPI00223BE457|nr:transporter substrate-binding domain-containing protein [Aestuariispira ectoiniformans]